MSRELTNLDARGGFSDTGPAVLIDANQGELVAVMPAEQAVTLGMVIATVAQAALADDTLRHVLAAHPAVDDTLREDVLDQVARRRTAADLNLPFTPASPPPGGDP